MPELPFPSMNLFPPIRPLKNLTASALATLAIFTVLATARAMPLFSDQAGADALLCANGTSLRDHRGTGNAVQLRGVNLGGWLEWQDWMCPMDSSKTLPDANPGHNGYDFGLRGLLVKRFGPAIAQDLINTYEDAWITARDLDNIKALGMNAVRAPFAYDTLLDEKGAWRVDAFKRLDWLVQAAWERGIYTIIDYHAFLPSGAEQDGSATGYWSNAAQLNETPQIWTRLAEHYRGNPAVAMYDLLNEPNNSAPKRETGTRQHDNRHALRPALPCHPRGRPRSRHRHGRVMGLEGVARSAVGRVPQRGLFAALVSLGPEESGRQQRRNRRGRT